MRIYRRDKTYNLDFTYRGERFRKAVGINEIAELTAKKTMVSIAGVVEQVDATDSKSVGGNTVGVRFPPPANIKK